MVLRALRDKTKKILKFKNWDNISELRKKQTNSAFFAAFFEFSEIFSFIEGSSLA
jgi:hypothetical protein